MIREFDQVPNDFDGIGTSSKFTDYHAQCIPPTEGDWRNLTDKRNTEVHKRLARHLGLVGATRAFFIKNGSNSHIAVEKPFFPNEVTLPNSIPLSFNPQDPADAVWLEASQAFVDLVSNHLIYLARGGDFWLAGRYNHHSAQLIVSAFKGREIESTDISVIALFVNPSKQRRQFTRFEAECHDVAVRNVINRFPLPINDRYPYGVHIDSEMTRMNSLGIILRP